MNQEFPVEPIPPNAQLLAIYLSEGHDFRGRHEKGRLNHPVREVKEVECVAGMGLRGDRYFDYKSDYKGQVTFIAAETIAALQYEFSLNPFDVSALRRNLVVSGVDLKSLLGKRFEFQGIEFQGSEECAPCYWMDQAVAAGAEDFLKRNFGGGLRARILTNGVLKVSQQNPD
ncbi:MOSC domain-containing protein [Luteolibacter pohnpeiensis]|uniref:MOSC domain-containing protein n=1 Tax=Luteolibacter pohnpeiensis TaxID=454153 RepID=A0A934S3S4_9BACT|nr:MOSC domain-containing protein [Luteolibacter pohnpeiensis]MBK1882640.1 MOSC domain-containing protein [Luteolibacter pohnpeiensis]